MRLLRPLRERDFALLWTGMTVSLLGDGIYTVAVAWQVYELHNDPSALALARLAADRVLAHARTEPLTPLYLRRPYAVAAASRKPVLP